MKKILAASICLILCLMCFAGCGKKTLEGTYYWTNGVGEQEEKGKEAFYLGAGDEFITFREDGTLHSQLRSTKEVGGTYTLDDKGNVNLTLKYGGDYMFSGKVEDDFKVKDYINKEESKYKGKELKWLGLIKPNQKTEKTPNKGFIQGLYH